MTRVVVQWHGEESYARVDAACSRAVRKSLDDISDVSQDRVPVQTSELKNSHGTDHDGNRGSIFYKDNKAAVAHENPRGYKYRNGKVAKFLEGALNEGADDFYRNVADEVRGVL